jgi:hypothetical protein
VKKHPRLHLVGEDPADAFNDLDKLREQFTTPGPRKKSSATFARIPHDEGLELGRLKISGAAWTVLIELDRLVLKGGGRNPVHLWSPRLRKIGIGDQTRARALHQLEVAGVVKVKPGKRGSGSWVTHLWYPRQDCDPHAGDRPTLTPATDPPSR